MAKFATGRRALGECDRCGFTYLLSDLRFEYYDLKRTNLRVCPSCWSPDHPQLQVGKRPVVDAEMLRDPRPDRRPADLTNIRWGWRPVFGLEAVGQIGSVVVVVPSRAPSPSPSPTPSPSTSPIPDPVVEGSDLVPEEYADAIRNLIVLMENPTYW